MSNRRQEARSARGHDDSQRQAHGTGTTPPKSLFVCFGACASGKDNLRKVVERFGHESFDFLFLVWDDSKYEDACFAGCTIVHDPAPLFWRLKQHVTGELARRYEYVFAWVEDVDLLDFDPQNFLRLLRAHRLEVAQPALSPDSVIYHAVTARQPTALGRYTDFVEEMVFVFRGDRWERFRDLISLDGNPWGWGYDEFAYSVCHFRRMAVIDAEVVTHLRKGTYHAEAFADRARTHQRFQRFYYPKKRVLGPIADTPLHKYLITPLRLNAYFFFAWLHSLPGITRLRPFLHARLHPSPLAASHKPA